MGRDFDFVVRLQMEKRRRDRSVGDLREGGFLSSDINLTSSSAAQRSGTCSYDLYLALDVILCQRIDHILSPKKGHTL